jgi:hypothetical protein
MSSLMRQLLDVFHHSTLRHILRHRQVMLPRHVQHNLHHILRHRQVMLPRHVQLFRICHVMLPRHLHLQNLHHFL